MGLIADTHMPGTIERLWPQIGTLFEAVDCILHAGDLHTTAVIEELAELAPTYVSRGNGDMDIEHPQLRDVWSMDLAGVHVGLVHHFPSPVRAGEAKVAKHLGKHFAARVPDVLIFGHTHLAQSHRVGSTLFVNPGSPTLPNNQSTRLGTVGLMHIEAGKAEVVLYQIREDGVSEVSAPN